MAQFTRSIRLEHKKQMSSPESRNSLRCRAHLGATASVDLVPPGLAVSPRCSLDIDPANSDTGHLWAHAHGALQQGRFLQGRQSVSGKVPVMCRRRLKLGKLTRRSWPVITVNQ
ncbi:hypothetical protein ElyMa_002383400 [Elysia marginata]|uniref:Uncharacterized protein n=1 Tax=Elysia marginata TaxID=1093978 RepID=A0AAV4GBV3_9GAST|nr:hypothetical protein ElyMa_002383400 [Elysia marginata]